MVAASGTAGAGGQVIQAAVCVRGGGSSVARQQAVAGPLGIGQVAARTATHSRLT